MLRPPVQTEIQGHVWTVKYTPKVRFEKREVCGHCNSEAHEITISSRLTDSANGEFGRTHREVAIHEFLHACAWFLTEEAVTEMAADLDAYLTDLDL